MKFGVGVVKITGTYWASIGVFNTIGVGVYVVSFSIYGPGVGGNGVLTDVTEGVLWGVSFGTEYFNVRGDSKKVSLS